MFALLYLFHHGAAIHNRKTLLGLIIKTCFFYCGGVHGYKQKEFILLVML